MKTQKSHSKIVSFEVNENKSRFLYLCSSLGPSVKLVLANFFDFSAQNVDLKVRYYVEVTFSLPNAYKLLCFDRNINGNRDFEFLEYD